MFHLLYFKEEKSSFSLAQYFLTLESPYLISTSFMEVKGGRAFRIEIVVRRNFFTYLH